MKWRKTQIDGIKQFGSLLGIHLQDFGDFAIPGQIIYLYQKKVDVHIRLSVFIKREDNLVWFSVTEKHEWQIGDWVYYRGPIGNGFQPMSYYENLLFIIPGEVIGSLNPLIDEAILKNKNISIACNDFVNQFNPETEIISFDDLEYAIDWADYLYLECRNEDLHNFESILNNIKNSKLPSEIFIHTSTLCGGTADCMVCAVKTRRGFQQVCKTGPVLLISEMELY